MRARQTVPTSHAKPPQYSASKELRLRYLWLCFVMLHTLVFAVALLIAFGGAPTAEDAQRTAEAMLDRARQLSDIR